MHQQAYRSRPPAAVNARTAEPQPSPHHGICRSERFGDLVLTEVVYPSRFETGRHWHELACFAFTLKGSSTEAFSGVKFDCCERAVLYRPAGKPHWDSFGETGAKCFLLEIRRSWIDGLPQLGSVLGRPNLHHSSTLNHLMQRAYCEWILSDSASGLAIQALVLEMASYMIRESQFSGAHPPSWLRRVKQRLDDAFSESPSLTELSEIGGVHPTHVARAFRKHHRMSVGAYLRQRRVEAAMEKLSMSRIHLTDIALAAGFANHAHFATVFKRITGVTPSEFRRLHH